MKPHITAGIIVTVTHLLLSTASAEVVMDGSLGRQGALSGPQYAITHDLGQTRGGNLFHSFQTFNLVKGDTALFSGPANIQNVISRVTGGSASNIDGTIASSIAGANLYMVNPAGIVFGPNAQLDISGSFYAGTAGYVRLGTNGSFSAATQVDSVLTADQPSAFGFVGTTSGAVAVNGSMLQLRDGKNLALTGGDITLTNANLLAPGGAVQLISTGSKGEAAFNTGTIGSTGAFDQLGTIRITDTRAVSALPKDSHGNLSGNIDTGRVSIQGRQIIIDKGRIYSKTYDNSDGAGIGITAQLQLDAKNESEIASNSYAVGNAGAITIDAGTVSLTGSSIVSSRAAVDNVSGATAGGGSGGAVRISTAGSLTIADSSVDTSGRLGNITLEGTNLAITGSGSARTFASDDANCGAISLKANDTFSLSKGSLQTTTFGLGTAGDLNITAGTILISNSASLQSTTLINGSSGNISIAAKRFSLSDSASLHCDTFSNSEGSSANIAITASDSILLQKSASISSVTNGNATAGHISLIAPRLTLDRQATISSFAKLGRGNAGTITMDALSLDLKGGSTIQSSTVSAGNGGSIKVNARESVTITNVNLDGSTVGTSGSALLCISGAKAGGGGGSIALTTPLLTVSGRSVISTQTQGGGNAGIVSADVGSFSLTGGSKIDSSTTGSGNGGSISIKAGNQVNLDGYYRDSTGKDFSSAIQCISWAKDGGAGGSISVTTPRLSVSNKAGISTQTQGRGNAGSIVIDAGTVSLLSGAKIDSDSFASGNGGTITVKAYYGVLIEGLFQISNSGYSNSGMSASTSGSGKGGSIIISTPLMELRDNGSVSLDSLGSGTGGDMNLNVANLSLRDAASLSSQSRGTGKAGDITILGGNALSIHKSSVTTASANADGGTIRIETPLLDLFDCSVTATVRGGIGNGGNIDVSGSHIVVDRSKIIANADGGNGGNININTGLLLTSPDAVITASSRLGLQGTVDIKAPIVDVSSGLVSLPSSFMNILSLNPKQCASTEEEISSFTVTREGIPLRPDRFYPGR